MNADLDRALRERGAWLDLTAHTKLRITGTDRLRFLNGQITNDLRKLAPGQSLAACVLTPKGKLCAFIRIDATDEAFWLQAAPELRTSLAARLERYLIADDVVIEDVTDSQTLFHVTGGAPVPAAWPGRQIACERFGRVGVDLWCDRAAAADASALLSEKAAELPPELAESWRIEAGEPRWGAELTEEILPAEAGLDRDAVDFHKGCYVGQETVSRIRSVGHVNKQLTGFVSPDGQPLAAGLRLLDLDRDARDAGWLTSAAQSFALAQPLALGYLKREASASSRLAARTADGAEVPLDRRPLPFSS